LFRGLQSLTGDRQYVMHLLLLIVQGEHKRTLSFQNDTENKRGLRGTSRPHQSIENFQHFVYNDPGCCCYTPSLDATSFENSYEVAYLWFL
jgi:hypothetical protein